MPLSVTAPSARWDGYAHPERALYLLIAWHLSFWVLAPALGYRMLPLDTLELLGWGHEWQWGYYKHPPLGAWLGEAALWLGGGRLEALYLLAQLALVVTLIYVWLTARLWLDRHAAVLATLVLEGSYFHTFLIPNFNMNSLQLPVWAGFGYHFLRAARGESRHWLAAGAFAALCLLSKYSGLLLLASAGAWLLASAGGRSAFRQPALWAGAALAVVLLAPHLHWLSEHWRLPWQYLRGFDDPGASRAAMHGLEPLRFAAGALAGMLLCAALAWPWRRAAPAPAVASRGERWALLALCFGPLLLSMLYGGLSGSRLKSTWAFPFFSLIGVAWLVWRPRRFERAVWRHSLLAVLAVGLLIAAGHLGYKLGSARSKTAFDGAALARSLEREWQSAYARPLRIVIGDHILSAIVAGYAPGRPSMLIRGDFALSPWLTPQAVRAHGAVVVCPAATACYPQFAAQGAAARTLTIDGQAFRYYFLPPQSAP